MGWVEFNGIAQGHQIQWDSAGGIKFNGIAQGHQIPSRSPALESDARSIFTLELASPCSSTRGTVPLYIEKHHSRTTTLTLDAEAIASTELWKGVVHNIETGTCLNSVFQTIIEKSNLPEIEL